MFNLQDWSNVMTLEDAVARHGMVRDALHDVTKRNFSAEQVKTILDYCGDAWNQCMGAGDPDSVMASVVRSVIPIDYVPLMRMRSGIPSGYYVVKLVHELVAIALRGEDLADDFHLRHAAREAFKAFEWKRKNASTLEEGFGFDRSEAWAQMRQVEDRTGSVDGVMTKIAKLAGRMFKAFEYHALPGKTEAPQEVDGIETGGDLDRMLDDEAASIGIDPETLVRVAEDRANQYHMTGEEPASRGPLVIAIDESGSMHHHREVWAKACAVALARVAVKEGRAVKVVHYSTVTDVHSVRPKHPDDMRMVAESHTGGGTDIEVALEVSMQQVAQLEKEGHEGADIVFITDGLDNYGEHHFDEMDRLGIELWTVAIDVDLKAVAAAGPGAYGSTGHLYTRAKAYVHISDAMIRQGGDAAVQAAVELKTSALGNNTRKRDKTDASK